MRLTTTVLAAVLAARVLAPANPPVPRDHEVQTTLITVMPDPPVADGDMTIGYDGPLVPPVTLRVTWRPSGDSEDVTLDPLDPTATIHVPAAAQEVEITDLSGQSGSYASAVQPKPSGVGLLSTDGYTPGSRSDVATARGRRWTSSRATG